MVIDGGFCKAYQKTTGIAGYTLIYNSACFRLVAHEPFVGKGAAIRKNYDIASTTGQQLAVIPNPGAQAKPPAGRHGQQGNRRDAGQTDIGRRLQGQIDELIDLVAAFRSGAIVESHKG